MKISGATKLLLIQRIFFRQYIEFSFGRGCAWNKWKTIHSTFIIGNFFPRPKHRNFAKLDFWIPSWKTTEKEKVLKVYWIAVRDEHHQLPLITLPLVWVGFKQSHPPNEWKSFYFSVSQFDLRWKSIFICFELFQMNWCGRESEGVRKVGSGTKPL